MMQARKTSTEQESGGREILVRVAVYEKDGEPTIMEVSASNPVSATNKLTNLVVAKSGENIPEVAVREVLANLVHASYSGVVISVLADGEKVRVADRGPGISSKEQALEFGFSGATEEALKSIRGIGAGLGIASAAAGKSGGSVTIEDNIGGGTVVTISSSSEVVQTEGPVPDTKPVVQKQKKHLDGVPKLNISDRQSKTLITVLECGEVGPSTIADRLEVSVSTAYRDLSILEEHGLVLGDEAGKRVISPLGKDYVEAIVSTWVR